MHVWVCMFAHICAHVCTYEGVWADHQESVTSASLLTPGATSCRLQVTKVFEIHCVDAQIVEPIVTCSNHDRRLKHSMDGS